MKTRLFWILVLIAHGILLHAPFRDSIGMLQQGDHGFVFYCYKKTLDGQIPYRDYYWNYGPLMPYYYAACFKFLGVSISSVLTGQIALEILSGVAIFSAITVFFAPLVGYLAAVWFWLFNPDFFYRFDQSGAILAVLTAAYLLLRHFHGPRDRGIFALPFVLYAACLVKLNIGLAVLAAVVLSLAMDDLLSGRRLQDSKKLYGSLALGVPLLTAVTYGALLIGLPDYYIRQCIPVSRGYDPGTVGFPQTLAELAIYAEKTVRTDSGSMLAALMIVWCLGGFFSRTRLERSRRAVSSLIALGVMSALSLHEFLLSGTTYRIYWATPLIILMLFFLLGAECLESGRLKRFLFQGMIALILVSGIQSRVTLQSGRLPGRFFDLPRAQVYLLGQQPAWKETVAATTGYLNENLKPGESFLALPYEPLYYFLTERDSPTWEFLFFKFQNIPEREEDEIISRLEKGPVRFVLMSNRMSSREPGLGDFGVTHCVKLSQYISGHYTLCASFGYWGAPATHAWNHAVKILVRNPEPDLALATGPPAT